MLVFATIFDYFCIMKQAQTRRILMVLLCIDLLAVSLGARGQIKRNSAYEQYFEQYKDLAIEQMLKYDIPASITLAQGAFESGAGKSALARKSNNHFGIKCHNWDGRKVYYDDDSPKECFRAYGSVYESYEDHSRFLSSSPRYKQLFKLKRTDYKGWAKGLKAAGYATNPQYAKKLIEIIKLYDLDEYDHAKKFDSKRIAELKRGSDGVTHKVMAFNGNYYIQAREGETLRSLSKEVGVRASKLAKINELSSADYVLSEGDIVWMEEKAKRAPKEYRGVEHTVREGESMYSISQLYGIRLKYLYKLNNLPLTYEIKVGDTLKLR